VRLCGLDASETSPLWSAERLIYWQRPGGLQRRALIRHDDELPNLATTVCTGIGDRSPHQLLHTVHAAVRQAMDVRSLEAADGRPLIVGAAFTGETFVAGKLQTE
jgi:hypothetical protein